MISSCLAICLGLFKRARRGADGDTRKAAFQLFALWVSPTFPTFSQLSRPLGDSFQEDFGNGGGNDAAQGVLISSGVFAVIGGALAFATATGESVVLVNLIAATALPLPILFLSVGVCYVL